MSGLRWGRRYLMCEPIHFGVLYEINPWMHAEVSIDVDRAHAQWEGLVATLRDAGAAVEIVAQAPDVPDMVFTANAGIVNASATSGPQFVPAHFRFAERQAETEHFATWFTEQGWTSAVLVSDPWHAMRAERMAEDAGIDAESSPTRQGPAVQTRATQFRYILRETAAYLLYRATGESVAGAPGIG